MLWELFGDP